MKGMKRKKLAPAIASDIDRFNATRAPRARKRAPKKEEPLLIFDEAGLWRRDAAAFAELAREIEAGLRRGAYDSLQLTFSERIRKRDKKLPAPDGGPRAPIDLEITYSDRPASHEGKEPGIATCVVTTITANLVKTTVYDADGREVGSTGMRRERLGSGAWKGTGRLDLAAELPAAVVDREAYGPLQEALDDGDNPFDVASRLDDLSDGDFDPRDPGPIEKPL